MHIIYYRYVAQCKFSTFLTSQKHISMSILYGHFSSPISRGHPAMLLPWKIPLGQSPSVSICSVFTTHPPLQAPSQPSPKSLITSHNTVSSFNTFTKLTWLLTKQGQEVPPGLLETSTTPTGVSWFGWFAQVIQHRHSWAQCQSVTLGSN